MIAFLFPGQGAQAPGMLHGLDALPGGAELVAQAGTILGRDLLAADTAEGYAHTGSVQVGLLVAGVASANALQTRGVAPLAVAGHSAGAFAAAVAARAIAFDAALRLVDLRGGAMAHAFPTGFGMGAVAGLDEPSVSALAAAISRPDQPVYAANVNAVDQVAVAGSDAAVNALLAAAHAAGARSVRRLDVAVPSHSPLMEPVAAILERALPPGDVRAPQIAFVANMNGRIVRDARRVRADLIGNVAAPVRWADATRALYESGVRTFIEMRPGRVLTDLAASAFPHARAVALETSGLESVVALTRRPVPER